MVNKVRMVSTRLTLGLAAIFVAVLSGAAFATTTTTTFQVQITIQSSCSILSASTLNFGNYPFDKPASIS